MLLRDSYAHVPGRCKLCTGSALPTVDTERDFDSDGYGGVLYICVQCVGEMAHMMGWAHPERIDDLTEELNRTAGLLDEQETENADLAAQLETLKEALTITKEPAKRGPGRPRKVTDA